MPFDTSRETDRDRVGPVVLDTDLGSDVDDLLALILLASDPRVDLLAVTTVYGDVALRARMANRVLRLMGRHDVPVHAGTTTPQSGRDVWWGGHEGRGIDRLDSEPIASASGVDALISVAHQHPQELTVVAIGPLTNIAEAIDRDPAWAAVVRQLIVMGGEFVNGSQEHNVRCDVVAAHKVLTSGIPSLFVGLDVTMTTWFDETDLEAVAASGSPLAALVDGQVREWWRYIGRPSCHPHDPLAVLAMTEPDLFTRKKSGWRVNQRDRPGALEPTTDTPAIEYASSVDARAAQETIRARLSAAVAIGQQKTQQEPQ